MSHSVLELTSLDQVAALVHPVRRRILAELAEPASPAEVARRVGVAPQLANYHVRALEDVGLAERVDSRQRRNLIEHRFRAVARSFALSSALALLDLPSANRDVASMSLDIALNSEAERAAFVKAVLDAVRQAAEPFRAPDGDSAYRLQLAIYPRQRE